MKDDKQFERVPTRRPGEEVLRRRLRPRMRLRLVPNIPGFVRFLGDMITGTPLLYFIATWVVLWLLFSMGIYFAESGSGSGIVSYGRALFVGAAAFSTAGISPLPLTAAGQVITGIWMVLGSALFFGIIVATVTAYFQLPRARPTKQIVSTVQYNLEKLDELSLEELETLKDATLGLIDARIEHLKQSSKQ